MEGIFVHMHAYATQTFTITIHWGKNFAAVRGILWPWSAVTDRVILMGSKECLLILCQGKSSSFNDFYLAAFWDGGISLFFFPPVRSNFIARHSQFIAAATEYLNFSSGPAAFMLVVVVLQYHPLFSPSAFVVRVSFIFSASTPWENMNGLVYSTPKRTKFSFPTFRWEEKIPSWKKRSCALTFFYCSFSLLS